MREETEINIDWLIAFICTMTRDWTGNLGALTGIQTPDLLVYKTTFQPIEPYGRAKNDLIIDNSRKEYVSHEFCL